MFYPVEPSNKRHSEAGLKLSRGAEECTDCCRGILELVPESYVTVVMMESRSNDDRIMEIAEHRCGEHGHICARNYSTKSSSKQV